MKNRERTKCWIPLGALCLALSGLGCATSGGGETDLPEQALGASVDALAEELAGSARKLIDLSSMRVCLREVTELPADDPPPLSVSYGMADLDYLAEEITEELEMALSSRFHMIDTELFGEPPQPWGLEGRESGSRLAEHFGASHLVVGTLAPHGDELQLKIRLVDVGNWVIVAAARGTVPVQALSDRSRVALGDLPPYRGHLLPEERLEGPAFEEPSLAAPPEELLVPDAGVASVAEEEPPVQSRALEPIESSELPSSYASWKPPEKEASDRTDLDLLLHSRDTYGSPVESSDPRDPDKAGPAEVRLAALGRKLK